MASEDIVSLSQKLGDKNPAVRLDAAKDILSTTKISERLVVSTHSGQKDVRSLAIEEVCRSPEISHIPVLVKAYVQAVKDARTHPDDLVKHCSGYVQRDVIKALFAILRQCDTMEKVSLFESEMDEAVKDNPRAAFLMEVRDAADLRKGQIRNSARTKGKVKPPVRGLHTGPTKGKPAMRGWL